MFLTTWLLRWEIVLLTSARSPAARVEQLRDGADKVFGARRWRYGSTEDLLEEHRVTVVSGGVVVILIDHIAGEVDSCEDSLVARIGEEACVGKFRGGQL